ncbi:MAG: ABC transporter substrate-binding protein [bacterium]
MQVKKSATLSFRVFILILFSLGQVSCRNKDKKVPARSFGGTLTIGKITSSNTTLNPLLETTGVSAHLVNIIFDGLVRLGEKGEILPCLADSWEIGEGGREFTFHLRKGVKFHDGHPLTADDVAFTLDLVRDRQVMNDLICITSQIQEIKIRDPYTISIHLDKPSASFIHGLTLRIVPRHLLQDKDIRTAPFNYHPIGTGPFRFVRWASDRIELGANEEYFLGRPHLDRIVVRMFASQRLIWANLMKGDIDAFELLQSDSYEIVTRISSFNVYSALRPYYYLIGFNMTNPLFQDKRVRQALNYAIDKKGIISRVLHGRGKVSSGTVFPGSWAFDDRIGPYPYDPRKAVQLLKDAGWQDTDDDHILDRGKQPFEFHLLLPEGHDELETASLMIMEQLSNIGVKAMVRKLPVNIYSQEHLFARKFEAAFTYALAGSDPDKNYQFWHSSQIKAGLNFSSYHNPRIDLLLDQGRNTLDQEQRKSIYRQYQEEMLDDPAGIFLFWREYLLGVSKKFGGVEISSYGVFNNIREWHMLQ